MLRLRAFRPTNDKIIKIQLHPTHPWLVTADASDHVSVWNWEHRQVGRFVNFCICFSQISSLPFFCLFIFGFFFFKIRINITRLHFSLYCLNSQVIYELKAGGVDERRLVGAKLEKLAEGESGITIFFFFS
jgi:hypothetical protein